MKHVLIAACVAGFAFAATGAYAQNDAMSKDASPMSQGSGMAKDAMGHDAMAKDGAMKKHAMKMKKKDAMSHDSMGKPMSGDKMAPASN
jgi:pentapeptide MXKDX repeat protein